MLIIPRLDDIQVNILKIIENHKFSFEAQLNNIKNYVLSIPGYQEYNNSNIDIVVFGYLAHLYKQGLTSCPEIGTQVEVAGVMRSRPLILTAIAYGYLYSDNHNPLQLEELINKAVYYLVDAITKAK